MYMIVQICFLPNTHKFWLLAWRRILRHQSQRIHMCQRQNSGRHEPWQAEQRADSNAGTDYEQIQMIATRFLRDRRIEIMIT